MMKYGVWMFGFGLSVCLLLWLCAVSEAQEMPAQQGGIALQHGQSPTGQAQHAGQPRPFTTGKKCRGLRRPARNRFEETKRHRGGGGGSHQRKSGRQNSSQRERTKPAMSDEQRVSSGIGKTRKTRKTKDVEALDVRTERVDDIPLLLAAMGKMGIQQVIDRHIPVQRHQRELSWGWTAVIWLAYILSEGDHRKVAVQGYIRGMQQTLSELTGLQIDELDFADDRLTVLLSYLAKQTFWEQIEHDLSENSIEVYELPTGTARVDATTVSGYHETVENGLFQYGYSKDDPHRPQIKVMTGSLDPLGMPLATEVVSGENADDGLYAPVISRLSAILQKEGVLYVGDSKLSSYENRLHIKGKKIQGHYLCPLPNTGRTPEQMQEWIKEGNRRDDNDQLISYIVKHADGKEELKAKGYELRREQSGEVEGETITWEERVLLVNSPAHQKRQVKGLEKRLKHAEEKLYKLTPPRGRGKRQITDEGMLVERAEAILKQHKVEGLLRYEYVKEVKREEKYIGRGRGSKNREKEVKEKVRYQVTTVNRNEEQLNEERKTYGWKAYVTDVHREHLDFIGVVKSYRQQYRVERIFKRLKSRLNIAPFYVKRDDQAKGMTHLLTLGVRVYTLIEFVVRRSLTRSAETLVGLHPENPKKVTDSPTCEKLLHAFSKITLTFIDLGTRTLRHVTPLSQLQTDILRHLGLAPGVYKNLEIRQSSKVKTE
jgi:transposase